MFERFTERARRAISYGQDEAREMHHAEIGTEHLLLGLMRHEDGETMAAHVLLDLGLSEEEVRAEIVKAKPTGGEVVTGLIPFTPTAKLALEKALREALSLGHNYIGTEHVLLGLLRESGGMGSQILRAFVARKQGLTDTQEVAEFIRAAAINRLMPKVQAKPDPTKPNVREILDQLRDIQAEPEEVPEPPESSEPLSHYDEAKRLLAEDGADGGRYDEVAHAQVHATLALVEVVAEILNVAERVTGDHALYVRSSDRE